MAFYALPQQTKSEAISAELETEITMCLNKTSYHPLRQLARTLNCRTFIQIENWVMIAKLGQSKNGYLVYSILGRDFFCGYLVGLNQHLLFKQMQQAVLSGSIASQCVFQPTWQTVHYSGQVLELFEFREPVLLDSLTSNGRFYVLHALDALEKVVGEQHTCFGLKDIQLINVPGTMATQIQFIELPGKAKETAFQQLVRAFARPFLVQNPVAMHTFVQQLETTSKTTQLIRQLHEKAIATKQYFKFKNPDSGKFFSSDDASEFITLIEAQKYGEFDALRGVITKAIQQTFGYSIGYPVNLFRQLVTHAPEKLSVCDGARLEQEAVWAMMTACPKFCEGLYWLYVSLM